MTVSQDSQLELPSKFHGQPVELSQNRGYMITLAFFRHKSCCTILNSLQPRDLFHRKTCQLRVAVIKSTGDKGIYQFYDSILREILPN